MNKKLIRNIIVLTLAAVVLVTTTVFTTMAYLLSTAKVSNVFTVGNVAIEMFETAVGPDGKQPVGYNPNAKKTADTNSYHILPGETYWKDPTVYIKAGSADTLLFVKARNQIANIETTEAGKTMKDQMEENGWRRVAQTSIGDWIYVYAGENFDYNNSDNFAQIIIPKATEDTPIDLFQTFTIDKACNEEAYKLAQGAAVTITAYAIQGGTFHDDNNNVSKQNVVDAWNAIVDKVAYEAGNKISSSDIYVPQQSN
ncbi:MAG: hypothetical protein E7545_03010 [Ruminococcaceae bacterium]|nr:hypothetical protein [Oscillospiraceae bacterium]